jgi:molybdopterin-guanine dinucleotide biosynthesis protein A
MAKAVAREPLCALWLPSSVVPLQEAFAAGERAVHRAVGGLSVLEVDVAPEAMRNVNTPSDLRSR